MYKIPSSKGEITVYESMEEFRHRHTPKLQEGLKMARIVNLRRAKSLHEILDQVDKRLNEK